MIQVQVEESFERAFRKFKKMCEKDGILTELKKRRYYEKPSLKRRKKSAMARKRELKSRKLKNKGS